MARTKGGETVLDESNGGATAVDMERGSRAATATVESDGVVDTDQIAARSSTRRRGSSAEEREERRRLLEMDDVQNVHAIDDEDEEDEGDETDEAPTGGKRAATGGDDPEKQFLALQEQFEAQGKELETWKKFQENASKDPQRTLAHLAKTLLGGDTNALAQFGQLIGLAGTASQGTQPSFDAKGYKPESDFEAAMLPHFETLSNLPQQFDGVMGDLDTHARVLEDLYVENLALAERLAAVEAAFGFEPETFDTKAFAEEWRSKGGQLDAKKEIGERFGKKLRQKYGDVRSVEKQQGVPRPETLRNGSGTRKTTKQKAATFADAVALVNEEMGW